MAVNDRYVSYSCILVNLLMSMSLGDKSSFLAEIKVWERKEEILIRDWTRWVDIRENGQDRDQEKEI